MKKKLVQVKIEVEPELAKAIKEIAKSADITQKDVIITALANNYGPGGEVKKPLDPAVRRRIAKVIEDSHGLLGGFSLEECGVLLKMEAYRWADLNDQEKRTILERWLKHLRYWGNNDRTTRFEGTSVFAGHVDAEQNDILALLREIDGDEEA